MHLALMTMVCSDAGMRRKASVTGSKRKEVPRPSVIGSGVTAAGVDDVDIGRHDHRLPAPPAGDAVIDRTHGRRAVTADTSVIRRDHGVGRPAASTQRDLARRRFRGEFLDDLLLLDEDFVEVIVADARFG